MRYFLLFLLLVAPAAADIAVEDIVINRKDDEVNIRVNLYNPGPQAAYAPIVVGLWIRANEDEEWRLLKDWSNIGKLPVGYKVSRDFFSATRGDADPALLGNFQVQATARSRSGQTASLERSYP